MTTTERKIKGSVVQDMVKVIRAVGRVAYDPKLYRTQEEYLTARPEPQPPPVTVT